MLLHHVTGSCEHEALTGPPTNGDGRQVDYFSQNEPAFRALQKNVMDIRWLKSIQNLGIVYMLCIHRCCYNCTRHTGKLECFNSLN